MRFFCVPPVFPSVHARSARVGTGERESGRDRGQQLVVRGLLRSPTGKLDMRVARIPPIGAWSRYLKGTSAHVALELTHVEPVDQRSGTRKADEVWHFWERPGQRHDALKRVAQTPACRLLFLVGVKHVFMGGEDSPRRVLCPWRAHPLASTLPAVARATAACSVRCEWMIGRGVGLLRGSSSGWCVRCSPHG